MKVRVTHLLSKIERLKQKNKGLFQRNRKLQKTVRKHIIINRVLKKEIRNMKKHERLQMLVAAAATLWLLSVFDFFVAWGQAKTSMWGHVGLQFWSCFFLYYITKTSISIPSIAPFWPCYDILDISLPLNGVTQGIFTFQVIFMYFDALN